MATGARVGRVEIIGYGVLCPRCGGYIPAPNSLIGLCIWSAEELRDYPRAFCAACDLAFAVGQPGKGEGVS